MLARDSRNRSLLCTSARRVARFRFLILLASAILAAGCQKKPENTSNIQAITEDLVAAAKQAAGRDAQIVIRPEMAKMGGGRARLVADNILIRLADASKKPAVEEALDRVAKRDGLTQTPLSGSPELVRFDFSLNGRRTQSVHIVTPLVGHAHSMPQNESGPKLAIIIDDIGNDPAAAEAALALPVPVTLSVLPHEKFSVSIAEEAYRRGDQVMLHLPMQAEGAAAKPEAVELRVTTPAQDVARILDTMLESVPHAIGVNNHEGSRATTDPELMAALMAALRARNLFFIDSRTTAATVAYDAARQAGVRAAYRNVFLDDVESREAVLRQLNQAARDAEHQGWAIAIGHPHEVTLSALAEGVPMLKQRGIYFVFASELTQ